MHNKTRTLIRRTDKTHNIEESVDPFEFFRLYQRNVEREGRVKTTGEDRTERVETESQLAGALMRRFQRLSDESDSKEAIGLLRLCISRASSQARLAQYSGNLSYALPRVGAFEIHAGKLFPADVDQFRCVIDADVIAALTENDSGRASAADADIKCAPAARVLLDAVERRFLAGVGEALGHPIRSQRAFRLPRPLVDPIGR
jgi:hypothetical protein